MFRRGLDFLLVTTGIFAALSLSAGATSVTGAQSRVEGPAQFTGEWSGTGVYRLGQEQTFCPKFTMKFDGNRYLMNFLGGERACEKHAEQFASVAMAYHDGQLIIHGQIVGSIRGNVLEAHFSMPEDSGRIRHWRMSMRREGNNLVYEESRTMDDQETPLISFAGVLSLTTSKVRQ